MRYLPLAALLAFAGMANAQNEFWHYPHTLNYTSRGNVGNNPGELHQGFNQSIFRGMGDNGKMGEAVGFVGKNFQDQNRATVENYSILFRTGTDAKGPDRSAAGLIAKRGPFKLGTGTGTGAVSYNVTTTFKTKVSGIPANKFWSFGLEVPKTTWSADGMSVWVGGKFSATIDNNLSGPQEEDMAWQFIGTATTPTHPSAKRVWRMGPIFAHDVLQVGNTNKANGAGYSTGGHWPDTAKGQPFGYQIRAKGKNGQIAVVVVTADFFPTSLPIFQPGPRLWVHPGKLLFISPAAVIAKDLAQILITPKLPPHIIKAAIAAQGLVIDPKAFTGKLTNAVKTVF